ncbi:hypothetical protein GLOIN_2v1848891 [Rhizophagus irregularis DAOM 181602=DAOM 197198]|nr:hypothetical protein GLOIN_2v1848891 [Rhizophagus irregularis DAOM 181602=DAOM 197198]GET49889.1 hypothetical protein GLOIN_2v1848891 [Rhizophagus irregularis DAOM 181602=DAOM 197198]
MSNKKCNSVSGLIKSNKKRKVETSETFVADLIKPKKKYLYICNCARCKGAEVDSRTQEKHTYDDSLWESRSKDSRKNQENTIMIRKKKTSSVNNTYINTEIKLNISKKRERNNYSGTSSPDQDSSHPAPTIDENNDEINYFGENYNVDNINEGEENDDVNNMDEEENDDVDEGEENDDVNNMDEEENDDVNEGEENDDVDNMDEEENDDVDEGEENDDVEDFFASPKIDNDNEEAFIVESLSDSINTEIIIWLFKFQQRFRLPDIALESLIKFFHIILMRFDKLQFENFPTSLYMAKIWLNIFQPKMQLAACTDCHKLHNVKDIIAYKEEGKVAIMNCPYKEYPNNPISSRNHQCNNPLSILKKNKDATIVVPRMFYPKPNIRQQLSILYQRPDFENMLKLSGTQRNENNIYSDIYDGKVWKNFPFDGSTFFTTETATTHLGLLLNLDWFQPFSYTQHSTGAIYASICNLPRSERNKPENIIYLGFLPGPKEAGLERINHYLAPIVDELLELWKGWKVPKTHQFSNGLEIKVALIVGSSDTPATRKLFGHGSAVMKCYRCDKRTTYSEEFRKTHYGGMQDYNEWVTKPADLLLHRQYAHEWLQCNSKSSREAHFKVHGIRWTEVLRLPYMDPIRFAVVDPMHCLFLGVAKWIIKSIFVNQKKLTMEQLRVAQNRMDNIDLPSDIGRIPPKIAIGNDGFSNLTADQWKTFIMIYSTSILWDMLDDNDRKILGHFVRACNLLVARFITDDDLKEAQERLKDMAYLIEYTYGPEFITSNIHLALHIPDCCRDYGPIYSFWLFPFERLNGYIGSYPNSNRQIEPELMKIVLKNTLVDYHLSCKWTSGLLDESLHLLVPKKAVGSLAITAEREELQHFLFMRHNTSMVSKIYGTEPLPGQMLNPSYINVVMPLELRGFLCEWYAILYEKEKEDVLGFMDLHMNQHARLQIGAEIFGSMISGRHEKNANIFAKWKAANDDSVDTYPGEVQYYFEHALRFPEGTKTHLLAYVKWYKPAPSFSIRFKHSFMEPEISNTELWKAEYFQEGCDSLLAVHRILCRATKFRNITVGKQKYLSIIPLNRRFNL